MACILKAPTSSSKGVVTFTTQERDQFILKSSKLQSELNSIKNKWLIGLHHNWHDYSFTYNPLFDFSMAGHNDLIEKSKKPFPLLPQDACNFSPPCFSYNNDLKFWDVLYVARAVYFKNIPEFFQMIRSLYDQGHKLRVLLISPIPKSCKSKRHSDSTCFCQIREVYNQMFSDEEQNLFTLLTTDYRDPFPFDIETVSHFYKSSRVFVHAAKNERRCRVAGYAWASGMPVVCMKDTASLLTEETQKEPYLFLANEYSDFPEQIKRAVEFTKSEQYSERAMMEATIQTSTSYSEKYLLKWISQQLNDSDIESSCSLENLDLRLGRHFGFGNTTNSIGWSLGTFVQYLKEHDPKDILIDIKSNNAERDITNHLKYGGIQEKSFAKPPSIKEKAVLKLKRTLYPIKKKLSL